MDFKCPAKSCNNIFSEEIKPYQIPCGHYFCDKCLKEKFFSQDLSNQQCLFCQKIFVGFTYESLIMVNELIEPTLIRTNNILEKSHEVNDQIFYLQFAKQKLKARIMDFKDNFEEVSKKLTETKSIIEQNINDFFSTFQTNLNDHYKLKSKNLEKTIENLDEEISKREKLKKDIIKSITDIMFTLDKEIIQEYLNLEYPKYNFKLKRYNFSFEAENFIKILKRTIKIRLNDIDPKKNHIYKNKPSYHSGDGSLIDCNSELYNSTDNLINFV